MLDTLTKHLIFFHEITSSPAASSMYVIALLASMRSAS